MWKAFFISSEYQRYDDIRVVFDGTSSASHECLWAPNFYLPTSQAAATILTFSSWMMDADFGEMSTSRCQKAFESLREWKNL